VKILRRVRLACATGIVLMVQAACVVAARDHGAAKLTCAGGYASRFTVTGDVGHPFSIDLETLRARPNQTFVRDVFRTGSGVEQGGWRGVLLWDLVNEAAAKVAPSTKNGLLRKYVVVTGSDCYEQTFSLGELSPAIGGNPIVVAYERDGELLGLDDGMARIIAPGDKGGARNVTHVARIRVLDPPG